PECLASVAFDLGQGFAPRIGSLRPGNENPKAYRPAIMKLPMVTIGAHGTVGSDFVIPHNRHRWQHRH
ncbi:MAG: hypothetical protein ACK506_25305, partial [Pirellula sp.]